MADELAARNMVEALSSVSSSSVSGFLIPSAKRLSTDWVTDRLPAVAMAITCRPGFSKMCSLRNVDTSSNPALVRVSANITSPSLTRMPAQ